MGNKKNITSMEKLRAAFITAINSITSEFINIFEDKTDNYSNITKHFHIFIHERIDSLLILCVNQCYWDADIILRSIAEASVKQVYISHFSNSDGDNNKINEFWNDLSEINRLKQSKQAKNIAETIKISPKALMNLILPEEAEERLRIKWPRKERQRVEQPWSFNEMIKTISTETNKKELLCLNRSFTQSSHLIHADETALGVIADRKQRLPADKEEQLKQHENRLFMRIKG